MTVYTDGLGNKMMGDCLYGNHYSGNSSSSFLRTGSEMNVDNATDIKTDLDTILSDLSYLYPFTSDMTYPFWSSITQFSFPGDTVAAGMTNYRRFYLSMLDSDERILTRGTGSYNASNLDQFYLRFEPKSTGTLSYLIRTTGGDDHPIAGSGLTGMPLSYGQTASEHYKLYDPTYGSGIQMAITASADSFGWYIYGGSFDDDFFGGTLYYVAKLSNVNTNRGYYSNRYNNSIIGLVIQGRSDGTTTETGGKGIHYINRTTKNLLATGAAQYTIACSDLQTPSGNWAGDMYVYDDDSTIGDPLIGRCPNLLIADGTYIFGKPVKITGGVFPDAGQNSWLPVGQWLGKTILMRCFTTN